MSIISVGPSLETLEETSVETPTEGAPATSSEETQETPVVETPAEEKPSEETPSSNKMDEGKPEENSEENSGEEDGADEAPQAIDVGKFSQEYFENDGELSEESYADLGKRGLSKEVVDTFMAGVEALQTARGNAMHQIAGGQEEFDAMTAWGTQNLSAAEKAAFNAAVDQAIFEGDSTSVSMLIPGIKARMSSEPNYVQAETPQGQGGIKPFANKSEMMEAMRDPRYRKDGQYVGMVQQRLAISNW